MVRKYTGSASDLGASRYRWTIEYDGGGYCRTADPALAGDDTRIDWGYMVLAVPRTERIQTVIHSVSSRELYVRTGQLPRKMISRSRGPYPIIPRYGSRN